MWNSTKTEDFTITGVAAPVPRTSSIQFNMLLPFDNTEFLMHDSPDEWDGSCDAFILLAPEADPDDVAPALAQVTQIWLQHRETIPKPSRRRFCISLAAADRYALRYRPVASVRTRRDKAERSVYLVRACQYGLGGLVDGVYQLRQSGHWPGLAAGSGGRRAQGR